MHYVPDVSHLVSKITVLENMLKRLSVQTLQTSQTFFAHTLSSYSYFAHQLSTGQE